MAPTFLELRARRGTYGQGIAGSLDRSRLSVDGRPSGPRSIGRSTGFTRRFVTQKARSLG